MVIKDSLIDGYKGLPIKDSLIDGYKVRNGVHQIKILHSDKFEDISHVSDFAKFDLDISAYL